MDSVRFLPGKPATLDPDAFDVEAWRQRKTKTNRNTSPFAPRNGAEVIEADKWAQASKANSVYESLDKAACLANRRVMKIEGAINFHNPDPPWSQ